MAIKSSNLYCYYVKNHNAIKVGYGDSSQQRMRDYAKVYSLEVDSKSLKSWNIPVSGLASIVESSCHQSLLDAGFKRHLLPNSDGQEAQELFHLGDISYEEAIIIIAGAIDETIAQIASKIVISNHKDKELTRRKAEDNRIKKAQLLSKNKEIFNSKVNECVAYIRRVWDEKFLPIPTLYDNARQINIKFERQEPFYKSIFFLGEKNPVIKMYKWEHYDKIKKIIKQALPAERNAKAELIKIHNTFRDLDVVHSASKILNIYSPGGWELSLVENPLYSHEWAHIEVRLIVQNATYCMGGEDASELINLDKELQDLVIEASKSLPAELSDANWNRY